MNLSTIRKAVAGVVGAALTWALPVVTSGHVDRVSWYDLAVAIAAALGVYAVPNSKPHPDPFPLTPTDTPAP